jgi:1-acyl-sn-glycerol-3-phosphate acyltransferase
MNISSTRKPRRIPNYTGPEKSQSELNESAAKWLRPLNKGIASVLMRVDADGVENIPTDGSHILCFQHEAMTDATLVQSLVEGDFRFIAAKEQFTGPVGKAMTAMGAIPVDRGGAGQRDMLKTVKGVLNNGSGIAIAPEGGIRADGKINKFKEGPAMMALMSKAESMVPMVLDYQPRDVTLMDNVKTYLAAGAVVAGGLAAAALGGPIAGAVAGALTGAVTGAVAGGAIGARRSDERGMRAKMEDTGLTGAGVGALIGAVAGGLGGYSLGDASIYLAAPTTLVTGAVTLGVAKGINERKHARVKVGEPIPVAPYREMADKKAARTKLTEDLHTTMVDLHSQITTEE